jgi:NADP-dependent 3-hydroxy acid dehydrogenase YdfG
MWGRREERRADRHRDLATGSWPGFVHTNLANSMTGPAVKAQIVDRMEKMAIPPAAIARAIAFAIEQTAEVDVNEIVIRPTAQT